MPQVNVLFHSVSGHTYQLANELATGIQEIPRCTARLLRIPEPSSRPPIMMPGLQNKHYEFSDIPKATIYDIANCDGLAIGTSVYWGNMSYATKYFLDSAAELWDVSTPDKPIQTAPDLARKPATVFTGGGSGLANDPAITGVWTTLSFFGMSIVTLGVAVPEISEPTRVDGGSPLGAQTFSRRPGDHPSEIEATIARKQGHAIAELTRAWFDREK